jgi:hypothetical protein
MKYSKGDKVRIRNIDWYEDMLSIPSKLVWQNKLTEDFIGIWCGSHVFRKEMREFCGMVMTIQEVGIDFYLMEEDRMGYEFTDEMIAGEDVSWMYDGKLVAERFNDGITSSTPKFKIDDRVETNDGLFGYIDEIKYDEANKCYMYYVSFIVDGGYYYENQLKFRVKKDSDSIVPKFKVGDVIVKKDGLTNSYLVSSVGSDYYCLSFSNGAGVLAVKDQDEWELLSDSNAEDIVNSHYEDELEEMAKSHNKDILNDLYNLGMENSRKEAIKLGISSEHIVCPDGYEFRDGDGNLIAVDKIVLAKKRQKYPQSFEECCEVLSIPSYYKLRYSTYEHGYHEYTTSKELGVLQSELGTLGRLLICRNAYWLTAGREMGLEGMWEPDWSDCRKFAIVVEGNEILTNVCLRRNHILVFPTEEMRDEFHKVFRKDIDECKEFL